MRSKDLPPTVDATRLGRLARYCYHHRKRVLLAWVVAFLVLNVASGAIKGKFEDKFSGGNSQSQLAQNLLTKKFPARAGDTADAVFKLNVDVTSPEGRAIIDQIDQQLARQPHVVGVTGPFDQGGSQISQRDPHIAYSVIQFDKTTQDLPKNDMVKFDKFANTLSKGGVEVEFGGQPIEKGQAFSFGAAELIGILAAVIILLVGFGSVVAMGLPILTAVVFGLFGAGVPLVNLVSHLVTVPTFATELEIMIGVGVGIDYALFIVTRFRQGLRDGLEPEQADILALATSGRAVLFAGTTVIISLFGMMLMGLSFVYGLAYAAIIGVVLVMAAALTLLPAMLGFAGRTIDRWQLPHVRHHGDTRQTLAWRWSRIIQRHPWATGTAALLVLVVLAVPLFSMRLAFSDSGNDPVSFTTRKAYDLLAQGFGPGTNGPLIIAATLPHGASDQAALNKVVDVVKADPGAAFVTPPSLNPAGDTAVIVVIPKTAPQAAATQSFVHRVRQDVPQALGASGIKAYVGGLTAGGVDASNQLSSRLFRVIGLVVILSFLLLMAVFRSVAVPIKAAVMNLLSIGAAYGVIVAVFQWGWLGSFFGIGKVAPIDPWVPLMLFTILFGLSMDYEVFLLSRVREEWLKTHDNATAVADGLAETARVITAAAAIMVCVFGSFVLGDLRILKLFGLGLATAVLVDASLVRMILVPATMELLGKANWWFPKWLDRAVPTLSVEIVPEEAERELAAAGASR